MIEIQQSDRGVQVPPLTSGGSLLLIDRSGSRDLSDEEDEGPAFGISESWSPIPNRKLDIPHCCVRVSGVRRDANGGSSACRCRVGGQIRLGGRNG
jgi:hypothetical protein